uniref:Putative ovule protein n=1 Tax=Solanum chacoense TaxID=4108 RepID=A0A0V0GV07_SOLCH
MVCDWVERGPNMMTRMIISQKTMEWLFYALKEASKGQENSVRRWKLKDLFYRLLLLKKFQQIWSIHQHH